MKYTNKYNLEKYIYDWLVLDQYDHNSDQLTLSTTTLMKPVRVFWLTQRYADKLEMDVSDLVASRLGNAIHDSLEKISTPDVYKENRITRKLTINGITYTVSGKYDVLTNTDSKWILRDIKTTSVWAYIYGGKDDDYQKQLSIYRWLLQGKHPVEDVAYIDFFFTDWQSSKAKTEDNYPPHRIKAGYKIQLMSLEETEAYVTERLKQFYAYKDAPEDELPFCTPEELWATEDTFAVSKPGAKRATKVCNSQQEAVDYISDKQLKDAFIELRPGKAKRCKYCAISKYCSQFAELQSKNQIEYF